MAIPVGTQAPDFTLAVMGPDGPTQVTLSEEYQKRPVLLLFYPAAFTHVCTGEFCDLSKGLNGLNSGDAAVFGVSQDSIYALKAWADREGISIPLLSDYQHEVTRAYDVVHPNFDGMGPCTKRAAFVVDQSGKVIYSEQCPTLLDLPDFDAIQACVEAIS